MYAKIDCLKTARFTFFVSLYHKERVHNYIECSKTVIFGVFLESKDVKCDGNAAKLQKIIQDAVVDFLVAWEVFKLKDVKDNTNVVDNLKNLQAVKKSAKNAAKIGERNLNSVSSKIILWSK